MQWHYVMLVSCVAAVGQTDIRITSRVVQTHFGGVGFHADFPTNWTNPEHFDQVLAKRWRELNPSFARVSHRWARGPQAVRDEAGLQGIAEKLVFMKESAGTEIYLTTMGLKEAAPGAEREAYAKAMVDEIEYLTQHGATNIKTFCVTNELSLQKWASMKDDLPTFRDYQRLVFEELKRRKLDIKMLATDASPVNYWNTLEWAAANMDDITGIYGGHHYANNHPLEDLSFYPWFLERCSWATGLARQKGKDFILGEFGPAQYLQKKHGVRWDTSLYFDTPQEGQAGIQTVEAAMAAINAGAYAMGYWTFVDYPEGRAGSSINHWGLFQWLTNGSKTRAPYYAYGLMTKFFRGPATTFAVETGDANVRAAAVRRTDGGLWSVVVVNRNAAEAPVSIAWEQAPGATEFRKYVYDPKNPPQTEDGDLQVPAGKVKVESGKISDVIAAGTMAVYTTDYDDTPPAAVAGLEVTDIPDARQLRWRPSPEADFCYYRILFNGQRIGSAVKPEFVDAGPTRRKPGQYQIVAVDRSGNSSVR